jgi:predicted dehydrogenase
VGEEAGEPVVTLVLGLASGVPVSVAIGTNSPGGSGHRIEVYGEDGLLLLANPGPDYMAGFTLSVRLRDEPQARVVWADPVERGVDGRTPPVTALVTGLVEAIRAGHQPWPSVEAGWRVQQLLDLAWRSSAERAVLAVGPSA